MKHDHKGHKTLGFHRVPGNQRAQTAVEIRAGAEGQRAHAKERRMRDIAGQQRLVGHAEIIQAEIEQEEQSQV